MTYQHILVPIDGSDISTAALKQGVAIAKAFGSKLSAISLLSSDPFSSLDFYYVSPVMKDYFVEAHAQAEKSLANAKLIAQDQGLDIEVKIIQGDVSSEGIIQAAQDLNVDLIVMGSHGRKGFQKFFLGSFAQDVLGNTELPVLIVKK